MPDIPPPPSSASSPTAPLAAETWAVYFAPIRGRERQLATAATEKRAWKKVLDLQGEHDPRQVGSWSVRRVA